MTAIGTLPRLREFQYQAPGIYGGEAQFYTKECHQLT